MKNLRIAILQINTTVGAIQRNCELALDRVRSAADAGAQLAILPELAVSGYPPEDLILKPHFIDDCEQALQSLAESIPKGVCAVVGSPERSGGHNYNTAAVLHGGELVARYRKRILPNYGVFDEKRVFDEGVQPMLIEVDGGLLALHICEDSWRTAEREMRDLRDARISALLNISASPFHRRRVHDRADMVVSRAKAARASFIYVNLVGGQDELVFDGASMVANAQGDIIARAAHFREDTLLCEIPIRERTHSLTDSVFTCACSIATEPSKTAAPARRIERIDTEEAEVYSALKLGLRDYVAKNGFKDAVIAISGGIDSALTAAVAVDALGPERVTGVTMPSQYTSGDTFSDAEELADNLGIALHTIPILPLYEKFIENLQPLWHGMSPDTTEENLQARIRGTLLMAISNKFGQLVLSTGNKSEMAVGYCTLYGDMVGGFSLLKDIPKTMVFALSRWRNRQSREPVIPQSTIERPPSAELRADQLDSDSLPDYDILDPILDLYIELDRHVDEIIAEGFEPATVMRVARLVDLNEYKRRQGAPGIKITPKAFGRDRRMPITNNYAARSRENNF